MMANTDPRKLAKNERPQSLADYEWQKNAALFWREKDRISEAEIARLQAENERLVRALTEVRDDSRTPAEIKIWCGAALKENHGKH